MPKYIDNYDFCMWIIRWRSDKNKRSSHEIGKRFKLIAENIIRNPCFISYTQDRKDEMISDALFTMSKHLPKYDPTYIPNPFSYFTNIAWRCFIQRIKDHCRRDAIMKPISYIENIEQQAFKKSTLVKKDKIIVATDDRKQCPHRHIKVLDEGLVQCKLCQKFLVPNLVGDENKTYLVWEEKPEDKKKKPCK